MHIEIEKMFFGDYRVHVWNTDLQSELDREYFCCGYESALATARQIKLTMFPDLPIFYRDINNNFKQGLLKEIELLDK